MAMPSVDPGPVPAGGYVPSAEKVIAARNAAIAKQVRRAVNSPRAEHSSRRQRIKTYILLLSMLVFGTAGNVILDKGMKGIGAVELSSPHMIWSGVARTLASGAIWLGIAFLLLYMLSYMLVLSWADYSYVMPFTALSYAVVAMSGYIWLGESVPVTRWAGIVLIVAGVFLISRTPPVTTNNASASNDLGTAGHSAAGAAVSNR